ncbi:MAG: histidine--tRNA ligase [Anaerolineae bacterium UTCFX2]|nr:MAG: histidine--tRNA ligase [Anaerolineae bacterium UTCFX2]
MLKSLHSTPPWKVTLTHMKSSVQAVKGTRDYYPEEMGLRNLLYSTARAVSESFGYQEWDSPFLETLDLYAAKSGEELVKEQAFVFPDRGGDLITLRPELTPSLARMVAQRQRQLVYPLRWWSWGPCWRYERPQKGRTREFFQWNVDLIGVDSPQADAEMIALAASFIRQIGLQPSQVSILVNNRALISSELSRMGVPTEKSKQVFRLIDRRDKMSSESWEAYALELGLNPDQLQGLKNLLADQELWRKSPDLTACFDLIEALGLKDYVRFAPQIVRGLDYYTGTVFEAWDNDGEFRAILGGGRYDNLVAAVGGDPLPAVGFAMGDLVVSLVLKKFKALPPDLGASPAKVLVTVFDESSLHSSFAVAADLRRHGFPTAVYPEVAKLSTQLKYGDRMGFWVILMLGPDELAQDQITIKDLRRGEQQTIPQAELVEQLRYLLPPPA